MTVICEKGVSPLLNMSFAHLMVRLIHSFAKVPASAGEQFTNINLTTKRHSVGLCELKVASFMVS
jgi:hypothetical protein